MYTSMSQRVAEHSRKDGRVVDCTALERRHTETPYRGFESLSFRQIYISQVPLKSSTWLFFRILRHKDHHKEYSHKVG